MGLGGKTTMAEKLLLAITITFSLNCLLGFSATSATEIAETQPFQAIQHQVTVLASSALHNK